MICYIQHGGGMSYALTHVYILGRPALIWDTLITPTRYRKGRLGRLIVNELLVRLPTVSSRLAR